VCLRCYRPVFHFYIAKRSNRSGEELVMLSGKSAIVTGSTSGTGLGIAQALAACGANLQSVSQFFVVMRLRASF
jgi:hypothetical protein